MMLKKFNYLALGALMMLTACTEDLSSPSVQDGSICFEVGMDDGSNDISITRAMTASEQAQGVLLKSDYPQPLYMHTLVEPWTTGPTTRAQLMEGSEFSQTDVIGISGYRYTTSRPLSNTTPNFYYNAQLAYNGGEWKTTTPYYIPTSAEKLAFYAYYPYDAAAANLSAATAEGPMTISYSVTADNLSTQVDLLTASVTGLNYNAAPSYKVPLAFRHALTAIRLELGDNVVPGYIRKVSFINVKTSGTLTVGGSWTGTSSTTLEIDYTDGDTTDGFDTSEGATDLLTGSKTLLMIPQAFAADDELPCIRVEVMDSNDGQTHTFYHQLKNSAWAANTMVTYQINTASINIVRLGSVAFPSDWDGDAFGIKTNYAAGDSVGVFAVDVNGYVKAANAKYVFDGTKWQQPAEAETLLYTPNCQYYLYYPYRPTLTGAPTVGSRYEGATAEGFFADVVSQWTTGNDQSTVNKLSLNDLQIGKGTKNGAARYDFTMSHQMGLERLVLQSKDVPHNLYYLKQDAALAEDKQYTFNDYTINFMASDVFSSTALPCKGTVKVNNNCDNMDLYYYVLQGGQTATFSSNATGDVAWRSNVTTSTATNQTVKADTAYLSLSSSGFTKQYINQRLEYDLAVGDVYYTDGALSHVGVAHYSTKTPVGIVFYKNTNTTPMSSKDISAGYTHAYVASAKDAGGYRVKYSWGTVNGTSDGNTGVGVTYSALIADLDGRTKTDNIKNTAGANFATLFPAAHAAVNYKNSYTCPDKPRSSEWFLPAIGQQYYWMMTMCPPSAGRKNTDIGFQYENCSRACANAMNSYYNARGFTGDLYDAVASTGTVQTVIWSSTEYNYYRPYYMYFNVPSKIGFDCYSTTRAYVAIVRPMLAF